MHDLDELAAFCAVMHSGHLTHSARQLGISKSTLSRRISQLEQQLGQPLLRRQSNRLIPTEAGLLFHDYGRRILALADQGRHALDALREEISGELVLEVHDALARLWIAGVIDAFMRRHPGITVSLETPRRLSVSPGSQAIRVWLGEVPETGLRQQTLALLECGLYAHPDYLARRGTPHHPEELAGHAWIDLLGETAQGLSLRHPRHGPHVVQPPPSRLRVDQPVLQADAIARGHGFGVMPDWFAARREAAHPGQLRRCLPEWAAPPRPVTLLHPHGHQPRKVTALLAFLRDALPAGW
ncbi:DNA-binding transcriptional LysR family regulator [Halomonas ventosae]|uniref:DNA-binding transcriptional LysR family regulator n=1 Tax=Halomonas ventosae TaxID=229007 RepID=A0A4R6ZU78_9GAMM|nr:LysR family transcriptional regulator [Halomonas ventosae]TDR56022.1 DNA-binding transcriptional LysR family regulator [Halomonas ventosae]